MSLRQRLRAGHFMRQAFDSETWQRHQSAYLTTEPARSVHHSQLILQLSWMQLSTVMVSSWVQAHSLHPNTAITKRVIACGVQTRLSETKNFQVLSFSCQWWFNPNLFIRCDQPWNLYRCWNSVLAILFARSMALEPSSQLFQLYHGCTEVCVQHSDGAAKRILTV
jgi:hypothetical protein